MSSGVSPLRVVLDTNMLFSAIAFGKDSSPSLVIEMARQGRIEAVVSPFIIRELETALARKSGWDRHRVARLRRQLGRFLKIIRPSCHVDVIRACEPDNRILECALDAGAGLIVTGDTRHLLPQGSYRGVRIISPFQFVREYPGGTIP
jgi:putative PIN family toxin of toxin-antitoxin system